MRDSASEPISRRAFLAGSAALAAGLASFTVLDLDAIAAAATKKKLAPLVLASDLYASPNPQRFVFAIAKGSKYSSGKPAQVAFVSPGTSSGSVDLLDTRLHKDGLPKGRGIYVVDAVLPTAGVWNAAVVTEGKRVPFAIQVKAKPEAPVAGQAASRAASPTTANTLGVNPICTRAPVCSLHSVSLADVIGSGKPVVVMFATPALCQSQYCGPVLEEMLDVMGPYADRVQFVHVEIYSSNRGAERAPTVAAWDLPSEPWLYTIDGNGTIVERLDGAIAKAEIAAALDRLTR